VLTIGNFDGVHRGHRELISLARREADRLTAAGVRSRVAAVTFDPPPSAVLRPESAPPRLTPLAVKARLLLEAGADEVVVLPPERELLELEAEAFFSLLRDEARVAHLVEGDNFCFGRGRRGTIDRLAEWTRSASMGLTVVSPVEVALLDMTVVGVSSSLIRQLAAWGRVRDAGICLGGPLRLVGKVVQGFRRGRTIGFPTANLDCTGHVVPGDGVYAGRTTIEKVSYPVALNVGPMPTFSETLRQIEAHLIGFTGDLYGQTIEIEVLDFLRDQRKFPDLDALKRQLEHDVALAGERAQDERLLVPVGSIG
jgi:riboflavin kinase/FMN adenylyltransferase